jgi:transposase
MGLYFQLHDHNIRQKEVCEFLQHLLRHLRGHVVVLWDNANIHGGEAVRELCRRVPRLHLERLPPYAPELNPDEGVWKHAKHELANGCPQDLDDLWEELLASLDDLRRSQKRMRGCVHQGELPRFMP